MKVLDTAQACGRDGGGLEHQSCRYRVSAPSPQLLKPVGAVVDRVSETLEAGREGGPLFQLVPLGSFLAVYGRCGVWGRTTVQFRWARVTRKEAPAMARCT